VQTVVETPTFIRRAMAPLTEAERQELITFLARNRTAGDVIAGTGGVRKLRFAAKGKGKSGGVRVIYYLVGEHLPIYALLTYGKNEQVDLTPEQRKMVSAFAAAIKAQLRRR